MSSGEVTFHGFRGAFDALIIPRDPPAIFSEMYKFMQYIEEKTISDKIFLELFNYVDQAAIYATIPEQFAQEVVIPKFERWFFPQGEVLRLAPDNCWVFRINLDKGEWKSLVAIFYPNFKYPYHWIKREVRKWAT